MKPLRPQRRRLSEPENLRAMIFEARAIALACGTASDRASRARAVRRAIRPGRVSN